MDRVEEQRWHQLGGVGHAGAVRTPGRGASFNPSNRFERMHVELDPAETAVDADEPSRDPALRTLFLRDHASSVITRNTSPDIGFSASLNPYRGCEHGCAYCYARPYHELLGFSAGLDFESRIMVKDEAPQLLRAELERPRWEPVILALSGVTDAYQPVERKLELTRRCLAVLAEFRQPVSLITKNHLVTRDIDHLAELARHQAVTVTLSITTLDPVLAREMEPRASTPPQRFEAVRRLREAGIPAGVNFAPVIPGLNDHEVPQILEAAAAVGASHVGWGMLRLPHGVKEIFLDWLDRHHPGKKNRVLARIRDVRNGRLDDSRFGTRMTGEGIFTDQIRALFQTAARRLGLPQAPPSLSGAAFRRPGPEQLSLAGLGE